MRPWCRRAYPASTIARATCGRPTEPPAAISRTRSKLTPTPARASRLDHPPPALPSGGLRRGDYDGHLEASTAVSITTLQRYAVGLAPLDGYELELGRVGTPEAVIDDLAAALSVGIDELTRPIDAIRHQAKTVTVGISRSDQTLLEAPLIRAVLGAGVPRDRLSYSTVRALADLAPAVAEVLGYTRYRLDGLDTISVVDQGGIAAGIESRTAALAHADRQQASSGGRAPGAGRSGPPRRPHGGVRPRGGR